MITNKGSNVTTPKEMTEILEAQGWVKESLGEYRSGGKIKKKAGYDLYIRRRNLKAFIDDYRKKSSSGGNKKPQDIKDSEMESFTTMGDHKQDLTPSDNADLNGLRTTASETKDSLPLLSSFNDYPSLRAIRGNEPCLLIGYDSEWETFDSDREMLSWQFSVVDGSDLVEFVFIKNGSKNLSLTEALGCILDYIGKYDSVALRDVIRYKYCPKWKDGKPVEIETDDLSEARQKCKYVYRSGKGFTSELIQDMPDSMVIRSERDWSWFHIYHNFKGLERFNVCLVCHAGKVDLSALTYEDKHLLRFLTEVQGGLVSLNHLRYEPRSHKHVNNTRVYPIYLSVADTMCHAPSGKKKLKDLGEAIGVEKVDIESEQKEHMSRLLKDNPALYMEYASTDSVVTLLYAAAMYGYNNALPVTITGSGASVMKESMMEYFGCKTTEEFDHVYRGLEKVKHSKVKQDNRPGYVESTSLEPISNDANTIRYFASHAYHGGYNVCTEVGFFPYETYDYDLRNAYPTAMCLVPDINWDKPIRDEIKDRELTLTDFKVKGKGKGKDKDKDAPLTPFVGYVTFKFPDSVKYPCIPVTVDGIPAYPRTSDGLDGVYVAGPFVWLALKLGAEIKCKRGYFLNVMFDKEHSGDSRSLAVAVKQLVVDRNLAKRNKGKGSLEELILKTMVSSGYGKTAQNVIEKHTWTVYKDMMVNLGCSSITNPVSAMFTTSIVQVELLAAQNQIYELGYMSCSVTTDGFISNCPEKLLKSLDLYGLRTEMEKARLYLTDGEDPEIWEMKHAQDDLLNITTRGNVSLHTYKKEKDGMIIGTPMFVDGEPFNGVCAHNSAKSGYESDSYDDRYWLMTQVLMRTGTVDYTVNEWTTFKDLVKGKSFIIKPETRHIRMDFDMKRKPVRSSITTDKVVIEGQEYEIAHFDTEPYENIEEFRLYRAKKDLVKVLRTESD